MHLRSKKQIPEMVRLNHNATASNVASVSETITNPPNSQNDTQTIPFSGTSVMSH